MARYFKFSELVNSDVAKKKNINNVPDDVDIIDNIIELMDVMDNIRIAWTELCEKNNWGSASIRVNSGYRSEALNKAINGSKTSEHRLGFAVDIEPVNGRNKEFWDFMVDYVDRNNIPFSQLINEKPKNGVPSWIHFSINGNSGHRKQIFTLI